MNVIEKARDAQIELRGVGRLLKALPKFVPVAHWGPSTLLERNASKRGWAPALAFEDERYTWGDVDARANQYAQLLSKRGIGKGDVVALMLDNRPDALFAQMGLNKLGAVAALINTNLTHRALVHAVGAGKPRMALIGSEHAEAAAQVKDELPLPRGADDVLVKREGRDDDTKGLEAIDDELADQPAHHPLGATDVSAKDQSSYIYTSGTTGLPKAAIITNKRYIMAASFFGNLLHEAKPEDTIYCALPLYHSNAQWGGWAACLLTGAQLALRRKFSASQFWDDVHRYDATRFIYIGELCRYLLNQPEKPAERDHRIRVIAGNGLRPDIWESFQRRFSIPLIREFYGATEGNAPMANVRGLPGMIGRLKPGQVLVRCDQETGEAIRNSEGFCEEVAAGETGLLLGQINAVTNFDGYVDEGATSKKIMRDVFKKGDAYFNSGDLLVLHDNRWVSFADRVGDTFRWKGENVSTNEVAETLNKCPGVLESNVYGVKVPGTEGRAGMASINVNGEFDVDRLAEHVKNELPRYMWPWFVRVQNEMRITGTFKHQKVDYRKEGYDPNRVRDPLYFFDGDRYVPLDDGLYSRIQRGETGPS